MKFSFKKLFVFHIRLCEIKICEGECGWYSYPNPMLFPPFKTHHPHNTPTLRLSRKTTFDFQALSATH